MVKNYNNQSVILSGCTLNSVILSACEGSMDSSANAFRMTDQSGRSMVEMLGVLAIIGVLSVGGIAGYTMAMNKHRANEILNAANKRAIIVFAQIQSGTDNLSIAEFDAEKTIAGATFTGLLPWRKGIDNRFTFVVSSVTEGVCEQLKKMVGQSETIQIGGSCGNDLTISYDNNMGSVNMHESMCNDHGGTYDVATGKCQKGTLECGANQYLYCYEITEGECTEYKCGDTNNCIDGTKLTEYGTCCSAGENPYISVYGHIADCCASSNFVDATEWSDGLCCAAHEQLFCFDFAEDACVEWKCSGNSNCYDGIEHLKKYGEYITVWGWCCPQTSRTYMSFRDEREINIDCCSISKEKFSFGSNEAGYCCEADETPVCGEENDDGTCRYYRCS